MNWQPTCELRFVIRHFSEPYTDTWNIRLDGHGNVETHRKWSVQVLQQKWVGDGPRNAYGEMFNTREEWRDVPTAKETE